MKKRTLFIPFSQTWESEEQKKMIEYSASSRLRVEWVVKYWDTKRYGVADIYRANTNFDDSYDVYVFQKALTDRMVSSALLIKNSGKKIIFDLCDAVWGTGKHKNFETMVKIADKITVSTFYLQKYIAEKYRKIPQVIPDRLDLSLFPKIKNHKETGVGRLVWYGNRNTIKYLDLMYEALKNLQLPKPVEMMLISDAFEGSEKFDELFPVERVKWELDTEYKNIQKNDVVLNPHDLSTEVGKAKSDNKSFTAWALGMPVVNSIGNTHRITTLLRNFLMKPELRNEVGKTARGIIENYYKVQISSYEMGELIQEV